VIVSASRRTDIPAFYAPWFMNRIREGFCLVPNPFNSRQISRISLLPGDVDAIAFWTRNPRPLLPHLKELDELGHRYFFLYTLIGYPRLLDPGSPPVASALKTFHDLASRVGSEGIIWRYDPIVCTSVSDLKYHENNFSRLARSLEGRTQRCIVSFVEPYRKTMGRLKTLRNQGAELYELTDTMKKTLLSHFAAEASQHHMELMLCAASQDFPTPGLLKGRCIDGDYLATHVGLKALHSKDKNQRPHCGCMPSKDMGMYDSCLYGCTYCYATRSHARAMENHRRHDPSGPMLIPSPFLCH